MNKYKCVKKCFHVDSRGVRKVYRPGDILVDTEAPEFFELVKSAPKPEKKVQEEKKK